MCFLRRELFNEKIFFIKVSSTLITLPTGHIAYCNSSNSYSFGNNHINVLWQGWRFPHQHQIPCILCNCMFVFLVFWVSWCRSRCRLWLFRNWLACAIPLMVQSWQYRCICHDLLLSILILHIHTCRFWFLLQVSIPYCHNPFSSGCWWMFLQVVLFRISLIGNWCLFHVS